MNEYVGATLRKIDQHRWYTNFLLTLKDGTDVTLVCGISEPGEGPILVTENEWIEMLDA